MGKIKMSSQFPRRSISKSPPPPPQAERASGSTTPPMAEELLKFDVNRDGRILWPGRAVMFEIPGHAATEDELSCVMPEVDADGDTFICLQEEEEEELPLGDGEEEAHGIHAVGGITVRSGAVTTAAVERRVTISAGHRVVITIDAEVETTTGTGGITTGGGVMGMSAVEGNNAEEDRAKTLLWMVGILGGLSDSAATGAAMYRSPRGVAAHGGDVAYRVGLVTVFLANIVQMLVACLVCRRTQTRQARAILKKILHVAIFTLVLSIALDGAAIVLNNQHAVIHRK